MHRLEMSDPRELSGHVTASLSTSSLPTIDVRTIASGARHHGPFGPEASQAGLRDMEPPPLFSNGVSRYSLLDGDPVYLTGSSSLALTMPAAVGGARARRAKGTHAAARRKQQQQARAAAVAQDRRERQARSARARGGEGGAAAVAAARQDRTFGRSPPKKMLAADGASASVPTLPPLRERRGAADAKGRTYALRKMQTGVDVLAALHSAHHGAGAAKKGRRGRHGEVVLPTGHTAAAAAARAPAAARELPESLLASARAIFLAHDTDGSGCLDVAELRLVLRVMGLEVPAEKVAAMMATVGVRDSGELEIREFIALLGRYQDELALQAPPAPDTNHARSAFAWMLEPSPRGGRDGSPNPADRLSAAHLHAAQEVLERRLDLRLELRDLLPAHEDSISLVEFEELLQRWEPPSSKAKTLKSLTANTLRGVGAGGRNGGALTR
jgi:hypothetical protein